jgi:hypothetical protein
VRPVVRDFLSRVVVAILAERHLAELTAKKPETKKPNADNQAPTRRDFFTIQQLAERWSCSRATVYNVLRSIPVSATNQSLQRNLVVSFFSFSHACRSRPRYHKWGINRAHVNIPLRIGHLDFFLAEDAGNLHHQVALKHPGMVKRARARNA